MIFERQKLEDLEDRQLAPYAVRSGASKGRAYLDDEPEYRTAFQRDRDRVLHTTAFGASSIRRKSSSIYRAITFAEAYTLSGADRPRRPALEPMRTWWR
jgi:hypothetical protein